MLLDLTKRVSHGLRAKHMMLVSVESCTGGKIAAAMTDLPGSSDVFDRGFVTYSNDAKIDHVCVSKNTLDKFGAVSEQVAQEMALGGLSVSQADIAVSVTGIAGPSGGSDEKPLGLVYIGIAEKSGVSVYKHEFTGDRQAIRDQTVITALGHVLERVS